MKIPPGYEIISLDVVSLFTNVSNNLIYSAIERRWPQLYNHINMTLNEFIDVIKFILTRNYFQFNNKFYSQIFGSAMGNPISPILADIVMQDLENSSLSKLCFETVFYCRYVDDILLCVPSNMIEYTRNIFNMYSKHLQFTTERPQNNTISFLDIQITVDRNNHIITNWYRKPTFSGRLLNFHSQHTNNSKIAIIYSLVDKVIKLSDVSFYEENLALIKQLLLDNCYPTVFIDRYIEKRLDFLNNNPIKFNNKNLYKKPRIILPFIKEIKPVIKSFFDKHNTQIVYSTENKFSCFIKLGKDNCKTGENTSVVYQINCNDCDASYVGQTSRRLEIRIKEHANCCDKKDENNALYIHEKNTNHAINFKKVKILDKEQKLDRRLFSEMFYIHAQKKYVNKITDTSKLNNDYKAFIQRNNN